MKTKRGRAAKMPIYEYQCSGCSHRKEILQRLNEKKRPRCDKCGNSMKRVISPSAFILKGSGWYVTDYPSESRKKGMESEKKGGEKKKKDSSSPKDSSSAKKALPAATAGKKKKAASPRRK
jgi:putative FmdB family regulatory protein